MNKVRKLQLILPTINPNPADYASNRVDVTLQGTTIEVMATLRAGLQHERCKLRNGKLIQGNADVVRYILETLEDKRRAAIETAAAKGTAAAAKS